MSSSYVTNVECISTVPVSESSGSLDHELIDPPQCVDALWMYLSYGLGGLLVLVGFCNASIIGICLCKNKKCSKNRK